MSLARAENQGSKVGGQVRMTEGGGGKGNGNCSARDLHTPPLRSMDLLLHEVRVVWAWCVSKVG